MRIVWKDSGAIKEDFTYRGFSVENYGLGWVTSIPGDNNVYRTIRCTKNAIDEYIILAGIKSNKKPNKRQEYGYDIIGKKNDKTG